MTSTISPVLHAAKPRPGRPRMWHIALFVGIVVALVYAIIALFNYGLQPRLLEHEVSELAGRARITYVWAAGDFKNVDTSKLPSEVGALVTKFDLHELSAQGLQHLTQEPGLLVRSAIGERWAPTNNMAEPLPGLLRRGSTLTTQWGGTVAVYKNAQTVLVAFDKVPQRLCDEADVGREAGGISYIVACNGELRAVADNADWPVHASDLKPVPSFPHSASTTSS